MLHNDSMDPILEKQRKEEMRTLGGRGGKTTATTTTTPSARGGVALGAVRGVTIG